MDTATILLSTLLVFSITATISIKVKRAKDRKISRNIQLERIEKYKEMIDKISYFSKCVKNLKVDVVEFESMRRWIGELLDQLQKHSEMMDQINTPSVIIGNEMSEEELEKMVAEMSRTGAISIQTEPAFLRAARPHPIDIDIVQAFEKRVQYYKQNPHAKRHGDWKRAFIMDFDMVDEWTDGFEALNNIENFDTVLILLSGDYYPTIKYGA